MVYKPEEILTNYTNEMIIIACGEGDVIKEQIASFGVSEKKY